MRYFALLNFLLFCFAATTSAQTSQDYSIQLNAITQTAPPSIKLSWRPIPYGTPTYNVFRKAKGATAWGGAVTTITTGDTTYTDNSVVVDSAYEYQVIASGTGFPQYPTGYIYAGIRNPAIHHRGALILIVDSTFSDSCATDIATLMRDINGDGWQVIRHDFPRTAVDTTIKAAIKADYASIPDVAAVLLLGHVAVPYSGDLNPDAHPNHRGAWPADVYYGSMTGMWTDVTVDTSASSNPLNHNIPGDGKWDQTFIPGAIDLQVSRIDFNNMPAFSSTEVQMMHRYLAKAHTYKMDSLAMRKRAIIKDNFGAFSGEAFGTNGFRNFTPMVSRDSIYILPFISSLADSSFQWSYACGGGSYTSASGIGTTADFAAAGAVHSIFTLLFGSYFGDWNYQNNFLRAPLCADTPSLATCWAGRPNWFLHHMALGENIGYGARLADNNMSGLYSPANYGAGWVHIALLGDLTLRTDYIKPAANLAATATTTFGANLSWTASPDADVIGYYVYRTDSAMGNYERISPMVTGTTFTDTVGITGLKYFMVRPVKLQNTPSGAYYNLGIGITDTATVTYPVLSVNGNASLAALDVNLFPNPAQSLLNVTLTTEKAATVHLYIADMAGHLYFPANRTIQAGDNVLSLDISTLPAGMYILGISAGDEVMTKKWVKL